MSKKRMAKKTKYTVLIFVVVLFFSGVLIAKKYQFFSKADTLGILTNQAQLSYTDSQGQAREVQSNIIQLVLSTSTGPVWDRTPCSLIADPPGFDTEYKCFLPIKVTGSGIVEVNWNPATASGSTAYPLAYEIKYKKTSEGTWTTVTQAQTKFTKTGLSTADTYEFQVAALDFQGNRSSVSLTNFINLASSDTQAPSWLENNPMGGTYSTFHTSESSDNFSATLRWEGAIDNTKIFSFIVEYQREGQTEWKTRVVPPDLSGGSQSHGAGALLPLTGLEPGTNKFKLLSLDEAGRYTYFWSNDSPAVITVNVKGTAGGDTTSPVFPEMDWNQGKATLTWDSGAGKYKISWPTATDNIGIDHYSYIVIDTTKAINGVVVQGTATTTSALINSGIVGGTKYIVHIAAYDAAGNYDTLGDEVTAPSAPQAPQTTLIVSGTLTEATSTRPIASAWVALKDASGKTVKEVATDKQGKYNITIDSPADKYTLEARKSGYKTTTKNVSAKQKQDWIVDFKMSRAPVIKGWFINLWQLIRGKR